MNCQHSPKCPRRDATDATAAAIVANHCEQGWFLLCNGVVLFDDGGFFRGSAGKQLAAA